MRAFICVCVCVCVCVIDIMFRGVFVVTLLLMKMLA